MKTVIEMGCGLNPHEDATIIVDKDRWVIEQRTDKTVVEWDLNKLPLPFKDNSADKIYMFSVLEHLEISTERFLIEIRRILKPGGVFVVRVPNIKGFHYRLIYLLGKIPPPFCKEHKKFFTFDSLYLLLRDAPFVIPIKNNKSFYSPIKNLRKFVFFKAYKGHVFKEKWGEL